ncbi:hypothetical protein E2562_021345 [Oryza meyeriana var. granulata]|uniref:Photosystem II 10 kDa polypeptide, chloroplastic n=1 Tax=Oryza meyeriana var. granulata TaxID=110450 RepID=A0A6G1BYU2_9ORYZ|nr:hypothetical protein E2562_021345 [Oryza meyeriana var. granulata]
MEDEYIDPKKRRHKSGITNKHYYQILVSNTKPQLNLKDGVAASGRPIKVRAEGKEVYQFASKYGANVDGYIPIYNPEEWTPSGDAYTGGKTGLLLWAVTLAGILLAGALLVYNTSALAS